MKHTGIIRRVDSAGQIVIPQEIRQQLDIVDDQPMEVSVDEETKSVMFTPYDLSFRKPKNRKE